MRTLKEKLKYNKKLGTLFSAGYIMGVNTYSNYSNKDKKGKDITRRAFDEFSRMAKSGDEFAKGIMCGVRDAANERKAKLKK